MSNQITKLKKILYIQNVSNKKNVLILHKKRLDIQNIFFNWPSHYSYKKQTSNKIKNGVTDFLSN